MSDQIKKAVEHIDEGIGKVASRQAELETEFKQMKAVRGLGFGGNTQPVSDQQALLSTLVEHTDDFNKLARKETKSVAFDLTTKAVGDMSFGVNFPSGVASIATVRPGIVEVPNRPLHVRDLIPKGQMLGSNFVYLKETSIDGAIAMASEGSTKSQIDFNIAEVSLPAQVVAGWLRISNQMLDDVPSMQLFLSNRLLESLLVVEDTQLMTGNGTPPNLSGVNTAGNFTAASGAATIDVEQLVQGIAQLAALSRQPSGIVLNPTDYFNIALNKAATSGDYSQPPIVQIAPDGGMRIAGVPCVWTVAQTAGTFTIGDFQNGSALLFRQGPRVEFFLQDGTNVRENKITIRVEERIAFAVFGSTYFVKGTF